MQLGGRSYVIILSERCESAERRLGFGNSAFKFRLSKDALDWFLGLLCNYCKGGKYLLFSRRQFLHSKLVRECLISLTTTSEYWHSGKLMG